MRLNNFLPVVGCQLSGVSLFCGAAAKKRIWISIEFLQSQLTAGN
ncbi:hypothetical protein D1BOALGB6SA_6599 [Olavius sp. associated proteobacterium Delta 1]|nr:hypothetical protein D1BOALGB6SA_6599 [Olavius sp. associated proteobacterium Delta 1]